MLAPVGLRSFGIDRHFGGYLIGKNCWQFFTVDRSRFPIIPERRATLQRARIGWGKDETARRAHGKRPGRQRPRRPAVESER